MLHTQSLLSYTSFTIALSSQQNKRIFGGGLLPARLAKVIGQEFHHNGVLFMVGCFVPQALQQSFFAQSKVKQGAADWVLYFLRQVRVARDGGHLVGLRTR